ncbi:Holo-[acyl-carrier-protein] synthase [Corynebacterium auriscanis]|nr:Holo-[acyl-carrier-protein] synthase [Corynebacterium auriscanis]
MILGIGTDLVNVPQFAELLSEPGTSFGEAFTAAEWRAAQRRAEVTGNQAQHLAGRWAVKEAFIKAWSAGLYGRPNPVTAEQLVWQHIEVVQDHWSRPALRLHEPLAAIVVASLGDIRWHVSLSHDGDYAIATVIGEQV